MKSTDKGVKIYCSKCEEIVSVYDCLNNGGVLYRSAKTAIICPDCVKKYGTENIDSYTDTIDLLIKKSNPNMNNEFNNAALPHP